MRCPPGDNCETKECKARLFRLRQIRVGRKTYNTVRLAPAKEMTTFLSSGSTRCISGSLVPSTILAWPLSGPAEALKRYVSRLQNIDNKDITSVAASATVIIFEELTTPLLSISEILPGILLLYDFSSKRKVKPS